MTKYKEMHKTDIEEENSKWKELEVFERGLYQ